jgi:predicted ATPase
MIPAITTVSLRNYKSIARSRVSLGSLVFLVGPNGSGKSNFLDALRFVADSLNTTLEQALRDRGGIQSVRRRSRGHPTHFGIRLDLTLPEGRQGFFAFKVGAEREGGFVVQREECRIWADTQAALPLLQGRGLAPEHAYIVEEGSIVESTVEIRAALERDRLALVALSGLPEFRPVYEALRRMGFYNLSPERIRDLQDPDPGVILARDGRNLAAVVRELGRFEDGRVLSEVNEHLRAVVPGVVSVEHRTIGPKETIEFRQQIKGDENPWRFLAADMSDGTLRAFGTLVAAFQAGLNGQRRISLVGIEEPETALHPGATEVIAVALILASQKIQVLATTHSPDLLDHKEIREDHLLAVSAEGGETVIGPIDAATKSVLRERLYLSGELLSQNQLVPDLEAVEEASRQLRLFSAGDE